METTRNELQKKKGQDFPQIAKKKKIILKKILFRLLSYNM